MADAGKDEPEPEFNPLGRKNSTLHPCCLESFFVSVILVKTISDIGVQGWRSGESTRLPPMWPGFDSQIRRQMWVEFVGSLLCTERFSPGTPVSPLPKNQNLKLT